MNLKIAKEKETTTKLAKDFPDGTFLLNTRKNWLCYKFEGSILFFYDGTVQPANCCGDLYIEVPAGTKLEITED